MKANDAFSNEALSLKDKIFAVELRMVSEILECLDNPEIAITGCLSFLKKLHSLPAIQEVFNVYMNGGVKSLMNKAERVDNVKSIMLINYVLFKYVSKFGSNYPFVLAWSTIELTERSFNPILHWQEISTRKSMGDELPQHPSGVKLDTIEYDLDFQVAVNGYGDVVGPGGIVNPNSVIVISKTGEKKKVELPATYRECKIVDENIPGVAVDKNNNVYIVKWLKTRTVNGDREYLYVLYILDANYNVKQEYELDFLKGTTGYSVFIAVKKNNDIVISKVNHLNLQSKRRDSEVFVCDDRGNLKHKFEREPHFLHSLSISNKNEIMIGPKDDNEVYIYSEEGNLKSTIKPPEGHSICDAAFHFVFSKIIVVTYVWKKDSIFLLCYTEEGELESTTYFGDSSDIRSPKIISHPNGPVAVVTWHEVENEFQKIITFI